MDQINPSSHTMISSQDVNGTDVYSPTGDHLGHIDELLIDKPVRQASPMR